MYNHFIIKHANKQFRKMADQDRKNQSWAKRYKTEIRPTLIGKHQRRIQGFAKKMECEPVILPDQNAEGDSKLHHLPISKSRDRRFHQEQGMKTGSARLNNEHQLSRLLLKELSSKYVEPTQSFRDRSKEKQINPPMKYGNKNSKLALKLLSIQRNYRKDKEEGKVADTRPRNFSRNSFHTNYQSDQNYSDFDVMSISNELIFQKGNFKTEKQIREEQELKALSHGRLYFKSLVNLEQKLEDTTIKKNIKDILVKCKVVKTTTKRKKKELDERDQFAEMMKMYTNT